jgi:hypothetical protein
MVVFVSHPVRTAVSSGNHMIPKENTRRERESEIYSSS